MILFFWYINSEWKEKQARKKKTFSKVFSAQSSTHIGHEKENLLPQNED